MTHTPAAIAQLVARGKDLVATSRVLPFVANGVAIVAGLSLALEREAAARADAERSVGLLRAAVERLSQKPVA